MNRAVRLSLVVLWLATLGGSVCLWVYLWQDPERWLDGAQLQYMPLPLLLPPVLLLAALMWPLAGVWRALAWLPALVVAVPVMGWTWGRGDAGEQPLRFMTFNAKVAMAASSPVGVRKLRNELMRADADIIVMQDANVFEAIQGTYPDEYHQMLGGREMRSFDQYVVLSRFPIRHCSPGIRMPPLGGFNYFTCQIDVRGILLNVITVHFTTPRQGLLALRAMGKKGLPLWRANASERLKQAAMLAEVVKACPRPCVLAGDLNAPEHSRVVQGLLAGGMRDAWHAAAVGWGYTHGHSVVKGLSYLRIDHILVSEDMGVKHVEVGGKEASEHRPLWADLYLQRAP